MTEGKLEGELRPTIEQIMIEQRQTHETRKKIFIELEKALGMPVVSYFTSFNYNVMIEDRDVEIIGDVLQKMDLSKGLALMINSPGGDVLAANRMINTCRNYSETGEFCAIVPAQAKSAATMICFGASEIIMGASSELGPVDPQVPVNIKGERKWLSAYNIINSYDTLFERAVKEKEGNLEPFLLQLSNYDEREIEDLRRMCELSEDITIENLASNMMKDVPEKDIRNKIKIFLTPEHKKTHGRPIYKDEASKCGLKIKSVGPKDPCWEPIYKLNIRSSNYVSTGGIAKCIESKNHSFSASIQLEGK